MGEVIQAQVCVLGSGPGGYACAYRAADLGLSVVMIERYESIGGVCLNVGCIPSKALLHAAKIIEDAQDLSEHGVVFDPPKIDVDKLRAWKDGVVSKLTGGLGMLAKQRKVKIVRGVATFKDANHIVVEGAEGQFDVSFDSAVIAAGSEPVKLPFMPEDPRVIDSTGALKLEKTDGDMLILGGGIIGLEMATVYHALGSTISVVEMQSQLMPGADADMVKPLATRLKQRCESIMLDTRVTQVDAKEDGLWVHFEGKQAPKEPVRYDRILVSVGRVPNGKMLAAEKAGVSVSDRGFVEVVDKQLRTHTPHIYAIGDIIGQPMLAHKSTAEGRLVAEVIAGRRHSFDAKVIPSVAYTDPEVAWVGLTETQAKADGTPYETGVFPWMACGRALAMNRSEGLTKILFDPKTHRVLGASITGVSAGDLIAELALAIEMGCDAEDIALTIHPHPTLSETVALAVEMFEGTATDLVSPNRKRDREKDKK